MDTTQQGKDRWRKIKQTARNRYLAMLHFDRLNWNAYGDLQVEIHKAYRIGGVDALPKRYDWKYSCAGSMTRRGDRIQIRQHR